MGSPNAAIVEAFYDAVNRRDFDAIEALSHPEVEVDATGIDAILGRYTGRAGMLAYMRQLWEQAAELTLTIVDMVESGDRVAVTVDLRARGLSSGVVVEGRYGAWYELRDGLVAVARFFQSPDAALADAGIAAER